MIFRERVFFKVSENVKKIAMCDPCKTLMKSLKNVKIYDELNDRNVDISKVIEKNTFTQGYFMKPK